MTPQYVKKKIDYHLDDVMTTINRNKREFYWPPLSSCNQNDYIEINHRLKNRRPSN